jgi:dipeptidyl aminopeptidase/acylaminoacyl peptidase
MRRAFIVALTGFVSIANAQRPATDIFVAPLSVNGGRLVVGPPVNITNNPGYDNQPSFTPDGRAILLTSDRDGNQTDIYRYDLASKTTTRVTSTPESEYSATVMPGGRRFSVIRVEKDSTQRLWSFALDGSDPKIVVETLKPVGYHAWLDANTLVMFVLGSPNALVFGDLRSGKMDTLARGIGRSLARLPSAPGFSFTQLVDSAQRVRAMPGREGAVRDIVSLPRGAQDLAWLSSAALLAGSGAKVITWTAGAPGWTDVADLTSIGVTDITRLAVSPDGKWLAFVAAPRR